MDAGSSFIIWAKTSQKSKERDRTIIWIDPTEDSRKRQVNQINQGNSQRVQYGRSETKRAITNVLDTVLKNYKYTSLPELNAVLQQYNVFADRGSENSRVYQNNGLTYRMLDSEE